jgi:putative oxidoreductase
MVAQLMQTHPDAVFNLFTLVLRLALGFVVLGHGVQKLFGWFGGYGFQGTMNFFTQTVHIPYVFGLMAIATEFFGALALILGLLTGPVALAVGITMVTAAWTVHRPNGFFMNWAGNKPGEGYEYFILAAAMALALVIAGGGAWSVDALLAGLRA